MSQDKKTVAETKLSEEEKFLEEKTAGFVESIAKTNTEKITKIFLEGLSEDTDDSNSYDAESGGEDSEDRPWRPSRSCSRRKRSCDLPKLLQSWTSVPIKKICG
jgi:hypothetical protein